ncbi:MAG: 6-phosphofructokinase [Planctomycetes bacterium]|nr:6-phosphofructokinase [Planctomycetota bacterium]MCB9909857.1 6-phosphofructokinase [Planctomycetota bacterium]MCB9913394.1 6-phosphofructokinase [Planctomycetota bacterium]HPF14681.1 ATP-dependent 6-phosphofructokinase [Planctomycetota bacterium]HRV82225.1 ATP-dependent 6-phosphofructokinase [Planctomycetota bacterium]
MSSGSQRIGILTGGGDCPGLNAVIRAVTKHFLRCGVEIIGIEDGFLGLIEGRYRPLHYDDVSSILAVGGTILGSSNKANPRHFATATDEQGQPIWADVTEQCLGHVEKARLDGLVVIGGDGTLACAMPFVEAGIPCIGIPKTIDNDVVGTDVSFGYSTAVQVVSDAIDRLRTTADSHHRTLVVEVMGRNAGWIALQGGLSGGADVILIPERPFTVSKVIDKIERRRLRGRRSTIVVVSEGARPRGGGQMVRAVDPTSPDPIKYGGIAAWIADEIGMHSTVEARNVVLGHLQRGGTPVAFDRVLATRFGNHAAKLWESGVRNRMVAIQGDKMVDVALDESAGKQRLVPAKHELIDAARAVWTDFGD